jgi:hypothetical protein
MSWFALGWTVAVAMVVYADAVEGGCRPGLRLVGPLGAEPRDPEVRLVDGLDPSEVDVRRWQRRRTGSW